MIDTDELPDGSAGRAVTAALLSPVINPSAYSGRTISFPPDSRRWRFFIKISMI